MNEIKNQILRAAYQHENQGTDARIDELECAPLISSNKKAEDDGGNEKHPANNEQDAGARGDVVLGKGAGKKATWTVVVEKGDCEPSRLSNQRAKKRGGLVRLTLVQVANSVIAMQQLAVIPAAINTDSMS